MKILLFPIFLWSSYFLVSFAFSLNFFLLAFFNDYYMIFLRYSNHSEAELGSYLSSVRP